MAKKHTTCNVAFEDYSGDLHRVTIRVPTKAGLTARTVTRMASAKARHKAALLIEMTCSGRHVELPTMKRRRR